MKEKIKKKKAFGAAYNLLGFFDLLLKIDMRINNQRYKLKKEENLLELVKNLKR